jgi:UDP-3-O-[3-hydroxymyristoyl] glucosamine N-acyltransferase
VFVFVFALSMIAGSVVLKKNSYVAPCSAILNQLTVGKDSLVGMGAVVLKNVDNNTVVAGVPATVIKKNGE